MSVHTDKIFVNLPVKDLDRSVAFFSKLGFSFNPHFTDENATCMVIHDNIFVMLLVESFFQTFTKKPIADASRGTEVIVALSTASREQVDELADKALAAGGSVSNDPVDHGFMYTRSFQDPDGHLWEVFHMDPNAVPPTE
ncbi:extradiol dioxygenase [Paenibacillus sp. J31TS4]|uniref:VOC family protein n=1 Tax=Paenibacillus sp. J31TS4 TaxID=2807195 RepID=UPI001B03CBA7|nr:VOC family protein [Paenibacillus sp. J31TS4]GIP37852.1 extradiol dioxygenase [Paenibacillus sp. J31TS4]